MKPIEKVRAFPLFLCAMALPAILIASINAAAADVVSLAPSRDNTLIEDPNGALSNGAGPGIFTGRTSQASGSLRRGVIAFDVAAQVPAGSTITSARLILSMTDTNAGPVPVSLHRLHAGWGEGTSITVGGRGAPSTPGDATWIHRFYPADLWTSPGGDFEPMSSASIDVDQNGSYVWGSTPEMVADVQSWLDRPGGSFGWILIGDESAPTTVKRFDSHDADPNVAVPPALEVTYEPPCVDPVYTGPGYWNRQCMGVPVDQGGLWRNGGGIGPEAPTEPGFVDSLIPCADAGLAALGFETTTCEGIRLWPPRNRCEKALRKLTTLILNVCSGRLQTSCPVAGSGVCLSTTTGGRIEELAAMILARDCRQATRCGGNPE